LLSSSPFLQYSTFNSFGTLGTEWCHLFTHLSFTKFSKGFLSSGITAHFMYRKCINDFKISLLFP
jgi:hypothetical protein